MYINLVGILFLGFKGSGDSITDSPFLGLPQHIVDTVKVVKTVFIPQESTLWQILGFLATLLFVCITAGAIWATYYWNKRNERRTLQWNKRNEWTHTLPFLSIEKNIDGKMYFRGNGWIETFSIKVYNIGLGPAIYYSVKAYQGTHEIQQQEERLRPGSGGYCRPLGIHNEPHIIKFRLSNSIATEGDPQPVILIIEFWDIYGYQFELTYQLRPVSTESGKDINYLSDPQIIKYRIGGKEIALPSIKDAPFVEFTGDTLDW